MPIRKVQFFPGEFYHIFNRGNGRQNIFYDDKDRYRFLQAVYLSNNNNFFRGIEDLNRSKSGYTLADIKILLEDNKIPYTPLVRVCADCLMPNHFHFLLQEIQPNGIVRFMQRLGNGYGKYFSAKHDRPGSLFQGRFKAVHVETDEQLKYLLVYINALNPVQLIVPNFKEDGVKNVDEAWMCAEKYNWSTHQEYMGRRESILIDKELLANIFPKIEIYDDFVKDILSGKERKVWAEIDGLTLD